MQSSTRIHVAVAVVTDDVGRVLLALRPKSAHQGGLWEFPGGKVESSESVLCALVRELQEEVDIKISSMRPLIQISHDYPTQRVLLDVWKVLAFDGTAKGNEGQELRWVSLDELSHYNFPRANQSIIRSLLLPDVYLITPSPKYVRAEFLNQIQQMIKKGIRLIQLRAKQLEDPDYFDLCKQVLTMCRSSNTKLVLNSNPEMVLKSGANGLHLTSSALMAATQRPLDKKYIVGASCHNYLELNHAQAIGVDFAVLSPVLRTTSHPNSNPLGWDEFQKIVSRTSIPVYALGGLKMRHRDIAFQYGAQGIAAISGLWGEDLQ